MQSPASVLLVAIVVSRVVHGVKRVVLLFRLAHLFLSGQLRQLKPVLLCVSLAILDPCVELAEKVLALDQLEFFVLVFKPSREAEVAVHGRNELRCAIFIEHCLWKEDTQFVLFAFPRPMHEQLDQDMKCHVNAPFEVLLLRRCRGDVLELVRDLRLASNTALLVLALGSLTSADPVRERDGLAVQRLFVHH